MFSIQKSERIGAWLSSTCRPGTQALRSKRFTMTYCAHHTVQASLVKYPAACMCTEEKRETDSVTFSETVGLCPRPCQAGPTHSISLLRIPSRQLAAGPCFARVPTMTRRRAGRRGFEKKSLQLTLISASMVRTYSVCMRGKAHALSKLMPKLQKLRDKQRVAQPQGKYGAQAWQSTWNKTDLAHLRVQLRARSVQCLRNLLSRCWILCLLQRSAQKTVRYGDFAPRPLYKDKRRHNEDNGRS